MIIAINSSTTFKVSMFSNSVTAQFRIGIITTTVLLVLDINLHTFGISSRFSKHIYSNAFDRGLHPKVYTLSVDAFTGNRTHEVGVAL